VTLELTKVGYKAQREWLAAGITNPQLWRCYAAPPL